MSLVWDLRPWLCPEAAELCTVMLYLSCALMGALQEITRMVRTQLGFSMVFYMWPLMDFPTVGATSLGAAHRYFISAPIFLKGQG